MFRSMYGLSWTISVIAATLSAMVPLLSTAHVAVVVEALASRVQFRTSSGNKRSALALRGDRDLGALLLATVSGVPRRVICIVEDGALALRLCGGRGIAQRCTASSRARSSATTNVAQRARLCVAALASAVRSASPISSVLQTLARLG